MAKFSNSDLRALADVFGGLTDGLTRAEIEAVLDTCKISPRQDSETASDNLFQAFDHVQYEEGDRRKILAFLCVALKPDRFGGDIGRHTKLKDRINEQLMVCGLRVDEDGILLKLEELTNEEKGVLKFLFSRFRFFRD